MAAALTLCTVASGCVQPATTVAGAGPAAPIRVTNAGAPFQMWEGAVARKAAEAECVGQGKRLRTSIYDRFDAGSWVFVEGCA